MADERRIVIELKISGNDSNNISGDEEESSKNLTDMLSTMQHPIKALESAVLGKGTLLNYAFQQAKQIIKTSVLYGLERYYNLTENYKAEQDLQNTLNVISNFSDGWTSTFGGALVGAKAGPAGAVIGGVIGLGAWGINTMISAKKAWDQQDLNLTSMRKQSVYQKVRLGLIDDGRGTQN